MPKLDAHDPFLRRRPCSNCPFRSAPPKNYDGPGDGLFHGLHPARVQEFAHSLLTGNTFHCHKSVNYGGRPEEDVDPEDDYWEEDDEPDTSEAHACAGALATMAREGDLMGNFHLRLIAMRAPDPEQFVKDFEASLDVDNAPVYDGLEEWVEELTYRYEDDGGQW